MMMSYVGSLKAHIWALIFAIWPPSPASVRIPAIILSAVVIWWLYCLMLRTLGPAAALAAAALTATDPMYVAVFALGPPTGRHQRLCLVGSALAFVRFNQDRSRGLARRGLFGL